MPAATEPAAVETFAVGALRERRLGDQLVAGEVSVARHQK